MTIALIWLLVFCLVTSLIYYSISRLAVVYHQIVSKSVWTTLRLKQVRTISLAIAVVLGGILSFLPLLTSHTGNYKTAIIESRENHFVLTVKGKRLKMAHDPISLFLRQTYEDSEAFVVPKKEGLIRGEEIPVGAGAYHFSGTLNIQGDRIEIELSVNNYDDKTTKSSNWNGQYDLVWKK